MRNVCGVFPLKTQGLGQKSTLFRMHREVHRCNERGTPSETLFARPFRASERPFQAASRSDSGSRRHPQRRKLQALLGAESLTIMAGPRAGPRPFPKGRRLLTSFLKVVRANTAMTVQGETCPLGCFGCREAARPRRASAAEAGFAKCSRQSGAAVK